MKQQQQQQTLVCQLFGVWAHSLPVKIETHGRNQSEYESKTGNHRAIENNACSLISYCTLHVFCAIVICLRLKRLFTLNLIPLLLPFKTFHYQIRSHNSKSTVQPFGGKLNVVKRQWSVLFCIKIAGVVPCQPISYFVVFLDSRTRQQHGDSSQPLPSRSFASGIWRKQAGGEPCILGTSTAEC